MLIEFIAEARKEIAERRARGVESLIASSANHDLIRGEIRGLDGALGILSEVLERYADPEQDLPEAVTGGSITVRSFKPIGNATRTRGRA